MSNWQIDTSHSSISFRVRHLMFAKVRGSFGKWQGSIEGTSGQLASGSTTVTIDATSIDTGVPDRDAHLRGADFLDADNHPTLTFASTSVKGSGDSLEITGNLTIRGTTRPVVLHAEHTGEGKDPWGNRRLGFSAKTKISRKEFGLVWNQVLEAGGVAVGDEIEVEIDLEAVQPVA